jgi:UDPglucose--hexose-1-phosphate uridylyltransferase
MTASPADRAPSDFERGTGEGAHEVLIESPSHAPSMPRLPPDSLRTMFRFLRDRVRVLEQSPGIEVVLPLENWGPQSGGTLWHPHAQLVALTNVPARLASEAQRFERSSGCLLEEATDRERADGTRVILDDGILTAYAPFGSEYPYEMRVVPRAHAASFVSAADAEVERLSWLLPALLRALDTVSPGVSYNWWVHGAGHALPASFHWHVEIVPRLLRTDGFELGADLRVNPVPPETAAERLRSAVDESARGRPRKG